MPMHQELGRINWQTMAVLSALLIAGVTGAIQLGSTQTHVAINGGRLDISEAERKQMQQAIAELRASNQEQDRRIKAIEEYDAREAANSERRREVLAAKSDVDHAVLMTREAFKAEVKRLDQQLLDMQKHIDRVSDREDQRHEGQRKSDH